MRKISGIIFLLFFFISFNPVVNGQSLIKAWDRIYKGNVYDNIKCILQTADHGLLVAGSSSSGIGGDKSQDNHDSSYITFDYWIVRTDSNGSIMWEKTYGGDHHEELIDIRETADHGFIIAGNALSDSSGDITEPTRGAGYNDYWMVKTDSAGNIAWNKRFGGNYVDLLTCIIQTNDGGYLLGGTSLSPISGDKSENNHNLSFLNYDYWVVKTDGSGNKIWDRTIGGDNYDNLQSVLQMPSGDYLLGGYSRSNISGDKTSDSRGEADFWIVKLNAAGGVVWDKTFGGDNIDWLFSMTLAADGGFVLAGTSGSSDSIGERTVPLRGVWDYWMVKTDASGNKLWDQAFGGSASEELEKVILTQDNGFLLSGASYSNISGDKTEDNLGVEQGWIVKTDSSGAYEWDRTIFTYGHDETGYTIQTHEGCYISAVQTESDTGGYKSQLNMVAADYWIVKLCYEVPQVSITASDTVLCEAKCLDFFDFSTNNPVAWYWSFPGAVPSSSTDQNPSGICYNNSGSFDVTLVAVNQFGSDTLLLTGFIQVNLLPPPVVTVSNDTLYCSPAYAYQWFIDSVAVPGANSGFIVMDVPGSYSVVIYDSLGCSAKSELFTTGIHDALVPEFCSVSPNPSDGSFQISMLSAKDEWISLSISDVNGKVIYEKKIFVRAGFQRFPVECKSLSGGIYFLGIQSDRNISNNKIFIR
jgi:hypothetical protein